jgi:hypothetical protein
MIEIIITIIGSSSFSIIVMALINKRSNKIDADKKNDEFWENRMKFLEEDMAKFREYRCFKETCRERVS